MINRINQGDTHLYNWTLEQLMSIKGCLTDRQVLIDQLEAFSSQLKTRLDTTPCVSPSAFSAWTPEPASLPGTGNVPQLPPNG
ncbi:MAG: hypothetical protein F6K09_37550 [Merismopedia sp. SIO2A8]|nr:hypothetical protein [Merismopedia sp. SIO2A8]